ncbi:putative aldolase class 2 protein [Pseudomonas reidholzensis]|uniref:Putative aldolase class 2 protein n=1 Tax=Pseudomonas reidholzensis TaxID=1785162 RepID=A0A383RSX4_9PSED|nr:putative aldolase class 2 protein [Pseudomonas reidholzensis]
MPVNQISMEFYGKVGYHSYEGLALDLDEQKRLVEDLDSNSVMILRNHGLLSTGRTVAEAFLRMFYL